MTVTTHYKTLSCLEANRVCAALNKIGAVGHCRTSDRPYWNDETEMLYYTISVFASKRSKKRFGYLNAAQNGVVAEMGKAA